MADNGAAKAGLREQLQSRKTLLLAGLALLAAAAGGYYFLMEEEPPKPAPSAARPAPKPAPKPAAAAPEGPAPDFDALAGAPLTGYDRPNSVRAGPAIVELSSFFSTSFWLKVNLPVIEDIELGPAPELRVTKVLDAAGKNWYDAANTFEKDPFFRRARLSPEPKPVPHLEGTRTVNIEKGLSEGSLQTVEGELKISIPADVKTEALQSSDIGKERMVNGAAISLKSHKGSEAVVHYRGASAKLLGIRGIAGGKLVEIESRQPPGDARTVDMDMQVRFKAPVTIIEVVVASGVAERSFPFVLTRGSSAVAPGAAAGAMKKEIDAIRAEAEKPAAAEQAAGNTPGAAPRAAASGAEPRLAAPASQAASQAAAGPAAPPAPRCVIKPVMTDAELDVCRRDRSPGASTAPAVIAAPTAAAPGLAPRAPATRQADCVIKPVMTAADMDACRR